MAYNPFDFFRRNQKSFFAILTAFVMVMFVLSFGQGDIFTWLPQLLRSSRGQGPVVATVDGRKLYSSDIERRKGDRILANQFMAMANQSAATAVAKELQDGVASAGERNKAALFELLTLRLEGYISRNTVQILQLQQIPITPALIANIRDGAISQNSSRFQAVLADPTSTKEDQNLARAAQSLLKLDQAAGNGRNYFANHPLTDRDRELFEFDLWLRKADKLGVGIAAADAPKFIREEFANRVPEKEWDEIFKAMGDRQGFNKERLFAALADEFRVRTAQTAVLGPTSLQGPLQAFVTPYQGYQFYKDQVVTGNYSLIRVPVENYLDQVPATPPDGELRELFTKYRDKEPDPSAETPGFREPRKLKVSWAEVRGDEPYYTKAADVVLAAAETQAKAAFLFAAPVPGGPTWLSLAAAPGLIPFADPALQSQYTNYKAQDQYRVWDAWSNPAFGGQILVDASLVKEKNLAAAAGAAAGSLLTHGSPFTPLFVLSESAKSEDRNGRARVLTTLLAPPTPAGGNLLGSAATAAVRLPGPLTLSVMRTELTANVKKQLAQRIASEDATKFMTETAKLAAKKDKSEAKAAIDAFLAERGLKNGASAEFRSTFTLETDPGLKPLVEKKERLFLLREEKVPFGDFFFQEVDRNDVQRPRLVPAKSMFTPAGFPAGMPSLAVRTDDPEYIYWRTAEVPAETPKNLDEARAKVVAAWREEKARGLAKAAAEKLQAQVQEALKKDPGGNQTGVVNKVVRDVAFQFEQSFPTEEKRKRAVLFLESGVAPLPDRLVPNFMAGREQLQPWQLKPRPEIPYPSQEMHDALLKHKDDPFGTALVLADRPKDTFYVAVLERRDERDSAAYYERVYSRTLFPDDLVRAVTNGGQGRAAQQAREQATALLMAEFNVANLNAESLDKGGGDSGD